MGVESVIIKISAVFMLLVCVVLLVSVMSMRKRTK